MECARRQKSYGVKVNTPMTRPTQSFAVLREKKVPWPQSCWIMKRRTRKPAAGIVMSSGATQEPNEKESAARTQSAASGNAVAASSAMLRPQLGSQ